MLDVMKVNIHVLYKEINKLKRGEQNFKLLQFIQSLVHEICGDMSKRKDALELGSEPKRRKLDISLLENPSRRLGFHEPTSFIRRRGMISRQHTCIVVTRMHAFIPL